MQFLIFISIGFISYFYYKATAKYNISNDSNITLLFLSFPFIKKYPLIYYILLSYLLTIPILNLNLSNSHKVFITIITLTIQSMTLIDIKCFRLPNVIMLPSILLSFLVSPFFIGFYNSILGGLIGFISILFLAMIRYGSLGGGDIKLSLLLGLILGYKLLIVTLLIGFIVSGLVSFYLLLNKFISRKNFIPYGPYFFLGFWVALLWGSSILSFFGY